MLEFGQAEGLRTDWPKTNGACFTIHGPIAGFTDMEYFKVSATGRLGVAFSRWKRVSQTLKADVASRLNEAVGSTAFSGSGKTGRPIAELFRRDASVDQFIRVWQELLTQSRSAG